MSEPGLNYKVTVTGASQGAAEVGKLAEASGKVADATGKAAPQAKGLAEALASLGGRNNPAKDVLEGITTAARGGEGAVFGLTKAFKGLKELVQGGFAALGPGGILVAGLGVLIGLLPKIIELFKSTKKSAEDFSVEIKKAGDEVSAFSKLKLDAMISQLNATEASGRDVLETFKLLQEQAQKIDDAQRGLEKAKIESDANLSSAEKTARLEAVDQTFDARREGRGDQLTKKQIDLARENTRAAQLAETEAANAFNDSAAKSKAIDDARIDVNAKVTALNAELKQKLKAAGGDQGTANAASEDYKKRLVPLAAQQAELFNPEKDREREVANRQKAGDEKQLEEANKRALAAAEKQSQLEERFKIEQNTRAAVALIEQQSRLVKNSASARTRLNEADSRIQNAGDRSEFLAANKDKIAARSDLQAAEKGLSELGKSASGAEVDLRPIAEAAATTGTAISEFASTSSQSISSAATAMQSAASALPPALDFSPVATSFGTYDQANRGRHDESTRAIASLQRQINQLANQLAASRNK